MLCWEFTQTKSVSTLQLTVTRQKTTIIYKYQIIANLTNATTVYQYRTAQNYMNVAFGLKHLKAF